MERQFEGYIKTTWPATPTHKSLPIFFILCLPSLSLSQSQAKKERRKKKEEEEEEEEKPTARRVFMSKVLILFFFVICLIILVRYVSYLMLVHGLVGESSKGKEKKN